MYVCMHAFNCCSSQNTYEDNFIIDLNDIKDHGQNSVIDICVTRLNLPRPGSTRIKNKYQNFLS